MDRGVDQKNRFFFLDFQDFYVFFDFFTGMFDHLGRFSEKLEKSDVQIFQDFYIFLKVFYMYFYICGAFCGFPKWREREGSRLGPFQGNFAVAKLRAKTCALLKAKTCALLKGLNTSCRGRGPDEQIII